MELAEEIQEMADEFRRSQPVLTALGDPVWQHLILEMMLAKAFDGLRVNDIAARSHLSRPAVSHHLQILKAAGLVKMRREGTKNYYFFNADSNAAEQLVQMIRHAAALMARCSRHAEEDE